MPDLVYSPPLETLLSIVGIFMPDDNRTELKELLCKTDSGAILRFYSLVADDDTCSETFLQLNSVVVDSKITSDWPLDEIIQSNTRIHTVRRYYGHTNQLVLDELVNVIFQSKTRQFTVSPILDEWNVQTYLVTIDSI